MHLYAVLYCQIVFDFMNYSQNGLIHEIKCTQLWKVKIDQLHNYGINTNLTQAQ